MFSMSKEFRMKNRMKNIANRKPNRWGNLSETTFEQDIKLLTDKVVEQEITLETIERICLDYQAGKLPENTGSFLVSVILYQLMREKI